MESKLTGRYVGLVINVSECRTVNVIFLLHKNACKNESYDVLKLHRQVHYGMSERSLKSRLTEDTKLSFDVYASLNGCFVPCNWLAPRPGCNRSLAKSQVT